MIKETLRKYPIVPRLERRLGAENYQLGNAKLRKNDLVEVSSVAVHYDERYYPDPYRYDPERFMPENKHNLNPYAYTPFGTGPRNCIGMRFAYQEAKICIASLVQKFVFVKTSKTPDKLHFPPGYSNLTARQFHIGVQRR